MTLTQRPNASTVGTLYIYDADRKPVWLLMTGAIWISPLEVRGVLVRAAANGFPSTGFNPNSVTTTQAGSFSIVFADQRRGMLTFTADGVAYSKPIERLVF